MIRLLVDSSSDIPKEELLEKNIAMAPLTVMIGENSYKDIVELECEQLYEYLVNGNDTVKTAQPSPGEFLDIFEEAKEKGDEIICVMLSSALSGTYQSACLAKDMADYDGIYVIDSLSATVAVKILVEHALKLIAEGKSAAQIVEVLEGMKGRIRIKAAIDTLKYLYLGGRVSKATAVIADTVNIKPAITVSQEGKVEVVGKYLGVGRAVKDLTKQMKTAKIDRQHPVYMIYSHNQDNSLKLEKSLEKAGITTDGMYQLGATLGVHIGPGAFGVIYIEEE